MIRKYHELRLPTVGDPMRLAVQLARNTGRRPFMIYESEGRWSFAAGAVRQIVVDPHFVRGGSGPGAVLPRSGHPFAQVEALLAQTTQVAGWRAYGWIEFDVDVPRTAASGGVAMHLFIPAVEVRIEPDESLIRAVDPGSLRSLASILSTAADDATPPLPPAAPEPQADPAYEDAVRRAVAEIRAGELRKVIISRRVELAGTVDLVGTYELGRSHNTPARSFAFRLGRLGAVGFSPEAVMHLRGRALVAHILAGTTGSGTDDASRDLLRDSLLSDPKEVFEHAISVAEGLAEFDALCEHATACIPSFMTVVRRGPVQHLQTTFAGTLRAASTGWDALAGLFPGSAVIGVPRPAARRAIDRIESQPRGLYGGAVLTCDHNGDMDVALALRTVIVQDGRARLQAGAGITTASVAAREFAETQAKLRSIQRYVVTVCPGGEPE